jgi:hypothetical protein
VPGWTFVTRETVGASGPELWRELDDAESLARWHPFVAGVEPLQLVVPGRFGLRLRLPVRQVEIEPGVAVGFDARLGPRLCAAGLQHRVTVSPEGSFHAVVGVATTLSGPLSWLVRRRRCAQLHSSIAPRLIRRAERRRVLDGRGWTRTGTVRLVGADADRDGSAGDLAAAEQREQAGPYSSASSESHRA